MLKKINILPFAVSMSLIIFGCNLSGSGSTTPPDLEPLSPPTSANSSNNPTQIPEVLGNQFEETNNPTQIPQNTPTPTELQELIFSMGNINLIAPDDVIRELGYFGGFGGGGEGCSPEHQTPSFLDTDDEVEVMKTASFRICGISIGEKVSVRIELPDNSVLDFDLESEPIFESSYGQVWFDYVPHFRDPKGMYHLVFSGDGWSLEQLLNVFETGDPKLYFVLKELIFYKFQERENVRLFAYETAEQPGSAKLIGWNNYQVNQNGELTITTNIDANFIGIGDFSGFVFHDIAGARSPWDWLGSGMVSCQDAPRPIGIDPYKYAEVIVDNLTLYDAVSWSQDQKSVIGSLSKGTLIRISGNPYCEDNLWWWGISCLDNSKCRGMVQEGNFEIAYLQPVQELPATPTPSTSITQLEPYHPIEGCAASRLQEGMLIGLTPGTDYVTIRSEPDTHPSDNKIGRINPGDKATIIGGPECSYGWIMWQIQTEAGIVGWVPESNGEEFWLMVFGE